MIDDFTLKLVGLYLLFAILVQIKGWEKRHAKQIYSIHRLENPGLYREDSPEVARAIAEMEAREQRWDTYGPIALFGVLAVGAALYFLFRRP